LSRVYSEKPLITTVDDPRSPVSEAYRTLRTNIYFAGVDKPIKKILITGANPSCGKSTTTANLGVTFAQTGAKVLLIDSDLRKPTMHHFFELPREPGLSNLLVDSKRKPEEVIQQTGSANLFLLSSGPLPPYPAEMLATERMKYLVEFLSGQYEYIIFDSPPVIAVTDASILAGLTDGTVLVLDYGRVTRDEAVMATEQLRKVNANIIGTILNAIPASNGYYNYYQYYHSDELEKGGRGRKKGRHSKNKGPEPDDQADIFTF
jgi:capsular exopolysaccharide synthesis family protein